MDILNKSYIESFSKLILRGWVCSPKVSKEEVESLEYQIQVFLNDVLITTGVADTLRGDLLARPELVMGRGFEIQIPLYLLANILSDSKNDGDVLSISIKSPTNTFEATELEINIEKVYGDVFSEISENISNNLSVLPFITHRSIEFLSNRQVINVLTSLYAANLTKDLDIEHKELVLALSERYIGFDDYERNRVSDLLSNTTVSQTYLDSLADPVEIEKNEFLASVLKTFSTMSYLKVKDVADQLSSKDAKNYILKTYYQPEVDNYTILQNFPSEPSGVVRVWSNLSKVKQIELWPKIFDYLQYANRYEDVKYCYLNPIYLAPDSSKESKDLVVINTSCIKMPGRSWLALNFVLQEYYQGTSLETCVLLLKEACWQIWAGSYFNYETFSHLVLSIIKGATADIKLIILKDINECFRNVLNYSINHNQKALDNTLLIKCFAYFFNECKKLGFQEVDNIEELIRPYYALKNVYIDNINSELLERSQNDVFLNKQYSKFKSITDFFNSFDANKTYTFEYVFHTMLDLAELNEKFGIKCISHLLSLSRYLQLLNLNEYQSTLLITLHERINDLYTAYCLEYDAARKKNLGIQLTTEEYNNKVDDSYWFERAIDARLSKNINQSELFVNELLLFLKDKSEVAQSIQQPLFDLLLSECLWVAYTIKDYANTISYLEKIVKDLDMDHNKRIQVDSIRLFSALITTSTLDIQLRLLSEFDDNPTTLLNLLEKHQFNFSDLEDEAQVDRLIKSLKELNLFPYTKVLIYSCEKYIPSRQRIIRDTWLKDLINCGIDYAFVVGGSDSNRLEDDYMKLQVLDTYEELPNKSLEMFRFARESSHHRFYYKIDDDCILNIRAVFGSPHFLSYHYYGRLVKRAVGTVDRQWHQLKSSTEKAKNSLDLSPEGSIYCDGSTGYILSYEAIDRLKDILLDSKAQTLVEASYFEDKLLGDLMTMAGVAPNDQSYNTLIKRSVANGRDVQLWDYNILPHREFNIAVLHTEDNDYRLNYNLAAYNENKLIFRDASSDAKPKWDISTDSMTPVLEIIKLNIDAIASSRIIAIVVNKNDKEFLPNFLKHHRDIGVEHFLYVDNLSDDDSLDYMMEQDDVSVFIASQDYKESRFAVNWQETLCQHYGVGRWMLILDSDELYVYDDFENQSIHKLLDVAESEEANTILAPMIDFYPQNGLAEADITSDQPFYVTCNSFDKLDSMNVLDYKRYGPFANSVVYSGGLRERIFGAYNPYPQPSYLNQKYNLVKYSPSMSFIEGLHFISGHKLCSKQAGIMHFKYHSMFYSKVLREVSSGQHWNSGQEYKRYLSIVGKDENISLFDPNVSQVYSNSKDLVNNHYLSEL